MRLVGWADAGPVVTAVVRCDLLVRGPVRPSGPKCGRRVRASGVCCALSVGRARILGRFGEPSISTPIIAEPRLIGSFWYVLDEFGASL
jgi:hypothetical protein